ncbi:MAG: hypothetical protein ACXVJ7_15505 [Acidimicrobiia bacterium]
MASVLTPSELPLYTRLTSTDRRHLVHSGREVERLATGPADPVLIRASILHDVGKYHAGLGVLGRSCSTVLAYGLGHERVRSWSTRPGWRGRIGRYERHGELGAAELRAAGSPTMVVDWAALHHDPDQLARSAVPPVAAGLLDRADR